MSNYQIKEPLKIHIEKHYHGGTYMVVDRDTSYWNPENGQNREDRYLMLWEYKGECYKIGSHPGIHPSYPERFEKEEWFNHIRRLNTSEIATGKLPKLP